MKSRIDRPRMDVAAGRLLRMGAGLTALCAAHLLGCSSSESEADKTVETRQEVEQKTPAPLAPRTCIAPNATGPEEKIQIGERTWVRTGTTLTLATPHQGPWVMGALTDIKENSPENLENLAAFTAWFAEKGADAIIVAGDSGLNAKEIAGSLEVLAKSQRPVFVIAGNREGQGDYHAALDKLRASYPNVFDLGEIRRVDTPSVDIVSLPGYFNPNYIHADDGCRYSQADVDALATFVSAANSPVVLVTHGGPKQSGELAIDRTAEGENVGDPMLTAAIQKHAIPFGIFGNIHEAGGRATDLAGKRVLEPNEPHPALYLNPGPADGVRWRMNDGSESVGLAALMTVAEGKASYEIFRVGGQKLAAKAGKKGKKKKGN